MTVERRNDEYNDQFPVGMRVLAVDDDPICLRLLEGLLRKCQYHVATRDRAIDALELLRENKDKFDLVISDVHMPDMDGFKLLELVGLEMDLPVIMLSANGDTKMVMKGITHGACDYLVKPVRLEELKNIFQHVLRRRTSDKKDQSNSDNREKRSCPADEGQKCLKAGDSDQDGRNSKRRKDQNEDDDEETDENGQDNDDPSSQKKARVVWSVELHRKFVAAVNQLGFERAVPKKILELMNVEKLSRENVASHLQKYRLYLKRLSSVANQQANMVAALGGADSAYLRMNPMNFHNFNGTGPFQNNAALRSLPPAGMLGRLNSPVGLSIHGLSPSGIAPLGHAQMTQNPITDSSKFQLPRDQTGNILQGMPTSLELDQLQIPHKKNVAGVNGDFSSTNEASGHFTVSSGSSLLLQDHSQEIQNQGGLGNQSSVAPVPFKQDSRFGFTGSNRSNGNWTSGVQSSSIQSTSFGSNDGYPQPSLVQAFNLSNNITSSSLNGASELHIPSNISRFDTRCQAAVLGSEGSQNMGYASKPMWADHKLSNVHHPDFTNSSMNPSMISQGACLSTPMGDPTGAHFGGSNEFSLIGHPSMNSSSTYHTTGAVSATGSNTNPGVFAVNGAGSLEDVVTSMIKWEQEGAAVTKGSDLGSYPLRTCI